MKRIITAAALCVLLPPPPVAAQNACAPRDMWESTDGPLGPAGEPS